MHSRLYILNRVDKNDWTEPITQKKSLHFSSSRPITNKILTKHSTTETAIRTENVLKQKKRNGMWFMGQIIPYRKHSDIFRIEKCTNERLSHIVLHYFVMLYTDMLNELFPSSKMYSMLLTPVHVFCMK